MKKIFFVGIGGIGMSALAIYAKAHSYIVSGSDQDLLNQTIDILKKNNITTLDENNVLEEDIKKIDILVITNRILKDHPLFIYAKLHNKIILYRSQFFKILTNDKKIIGITGSHGKTTTTGLLSNIFIENKKKPTVFVGGIIKKYGTNIIKGSSDFIIFEADDAYRSFLDINPFISVITSISLEHLETYKNLEEIEESFRAYAESTNQNGFIVINNDTNQLKDFIKTINHPKIITYGCNKDSDYKINNIFYNKHNTFFSLYYKNINIGKFKIKMLGIHNVKNATAAIIVSLQLKLSFKEIKYSLIKHQGVTRRFEYKGQYNNLKIYDDYAHHPNEIDAVLSIIKTKNIKVYIFFQPHKYIRIKNLWNDFVNVFIKYKKNIECLYITDVYSAGDLFDNIFNSENLVNTLKKEIKKSFYIPLNDNFNNFFSYNEQLIKKKEETIILTLGAGILNRFSDKLKNNN
jgi:UDP-N-acetylmuramate--alanine ligase